MVKKAIIIRISISISIPISIYFGLKYFRSPKKEKVDTKVTASINQSGGITAGRVDININPQPPPKEPKLDIYYKDKLISGIPTKVKKEGNVIKLPDIFIKNTSKEIVKVTSVRLYSSRKLDYLKSYEKETNIEIGVSTEEWQKHDYPSKDFSTVFERRKEIYLSHGEPWQFPPLCLRFNEGITSNDLIKFEIYYGGEKPIVAEFIIE